MKFSLIGILSAVVLSLGFSSAVIAGGTSQPSSRSSPDPTNSEILTEDTSSQTPAQTTETNEKPSSAKDPQSGEEIQPESGVRLNRISNDSQKIPSTGTQSPNSNENQAEQQQTPPTSGTETSTPNTKQK